MSNSEQPYLFELSKIGSPAIGFISVAENSTLPFAIKRVYWTYYTPHEVIRGNHAHKNLEQILTAVSGQIIVTTINRNGREQTFTLDKPTTALYIPPLCWRTLQFSHSAVLMCLASDEFAESDYIRDKDQFMSLIQGK